MTVVWPAAVPSRLACAAACGRGSSPAVHASRRRLASIAAEVIREIIKKPDGAGTPPAIEEHDELTHGALVAQQCYGASRIDRRAAAPARSCCSVRPTQLDPPEPADERFSSHSSNCGIHRDPTREAARL
jgi:hypothetical protein